MVASTNQEGDCTMFSELTRLSLIATVAITAAASAAARAGPKDDSKQVREPARLQPESGIAALESGNPHSVDFALRDIGSRSPTSEELDALEIGDPNSIDYPKRPIGSHAATNEELRSIETGNPDAVNNREWLTP